MNGCNVVGFVVLFACLGGCVSNKDSQVDFIALDGHRLQVNSKGEVEMTADQYGRLMNVDAVLLAPDELRLLKSDAEAFYGVVAKEAIDRVTLLIGRGSLSEELNKALKRHGVSKVVWLAKHEFYVPEPFAIVDENLEMALAESLFNFPLSHTLDNENGLLVVTIRDAAALQL